MKYWAGKRIGILGGGQLARMLTLRGHQMGLDIHILSALKSDPAAQVTSQWTQGDPDSLTDLKKFFRKMDIVTFESEFIDIKKVRQAQKNTTLKIYPQASLMKRFQDRLTQKKWLSKNGLTTAPFLKVDTFAQAQSAFIQFKKTMVLKKRLFGYDGYGTFVIKSSADLIKIRTVIENESVGFIAEEYIPFRRELAFLIARNVSGQTVTYPLVESHQVDSRCLWVKGPVSTSKSAALIKQAKKALTLSRYVGVMAFELFDTPKGLIINEVAPRVHNSGHYSIDALSIDQFQCHLLAITNEELPQPKLLAKAFAMHNLLGKTKKLPRWSSPKDVFLHWYGKADNRPGRKMGHLNALGTTSKEALQKTKNAHKEFYL